MAGPVAQWPDALELAEHRQGEQISRFGLRSVKDDPNHAVIAKWQVKRGVPESCFLLVLSKILSQKFFDVLRTQQQLGYVVGRPVRILEWIWNGI